MKKINITEIKGIQIGQVENQKAGTGCTVIICKDGATAGVDVRGGGPATRETDLLNPINMVQQINAVMPVSYTHLDVYKRQILHQLF